MEYKKNAYVYIWNFTKSVVTKIKINSLCKLSKSFKLLTKKRLPVQKYERQMCHNLEMQYIYSSL